MEFKVDGLAHELCKIIDTIDKVCVDKDEKIDKQIKLFKELVYKEDDVFYIKFPEGFYNVAR